MLEHLQRGFPVDADLLGTSGLERVIARGIERARVHQLRTFGEVCQFIDLGMALGTELDRDPLLPWAEQILTRKTLVGSRMAELNARALRHIERVAGQGGVPALRAALRIRGAYDVRFDVDAATDAHIQAYLERTHPTRVAELAAACSWRDFFDHLNSMASVHQLDAPRPRAALAALLCLLGGRFTTDPQHPWAEAALAQTAGQTPDARGRRLFDSAVAWLDRAVPLFRRRGG